METKQNLTHEQRLELANKKAAELAAALDNDRFRLHYHLMPRTGWMNDPNGLIQFNGEYHAFYQHYPFEPHNGPMHWGHAKSSDLVHWEHLPIALAPSEPYDLGSGNNGYGCWSGSAVDDNGKLTLIYTGHVDGNNPVEVQCLAVSKDGVQFEKAANPVIPGPPEEGCFGFRDPKVWKHEDKWYMVIGSGKDGHGKVQLYTSDSLHHWQYSGAAAQSDGTMGDMWECPDLFPLGEANHVLIISPMNMGSTKTMYLSGSFNYDSGKLETAYSERLDYGFDFYAPQTLLDDQGRRIMIGWMNIWGAKMPEQEDGWMGAMTIPRELKLTEKGTITMEPVAELTALRGKHHSLERQVIERDTVLRLHALQSDALEIVAVFEVSDSHEEEFGLLLRCSADDSQYTEISYCTSNGQLLMDRNQSGQGDGGISELTIEPMERGRLKLHLFLDRSSVELFINGGHKTITNRIYPNPDSLGIKLFSRQGSTILHSFDAWELQSIW
ncbi:invertase [Paenibacillus baekrokdamisoli]|uniref:Sucrose-6-phosphate hydrolase n=1 Tax=Paenibacillus baekrokdamisoli TaxID=1712516 RepID=A0A3G9JME0_9BACL|nr:glycoside hydrolase family 32 protein [Paenibacillus baekrokdamisoli]MBB3071808.1 beta-fructofuranosidase [Paenibacillus baekrokdamisoli]BBH24209.1 invertase [Paenibacillus baekrokdamisoli]